MNFDTTNNATILCTKNELNKNISSTQIKRASDAGASFASEMKNSSQQKEISDTVKNDKDTASIDKTEKTDKTDKTDEAKKTETKNSEKITKEQSSQELQGEVSTENQAQNYTSTQDQNQNNNQQNPYTPLTDKIQAYMSANGVDINFVNINPMNATSQNQLSGIATTVDYSSIKMSDTDAKFFADLVTKTDISTGSVIAEFEKALQSGDVKNIQSTAKASFALIEALKESAKNHQAFRIDFDKDISVVLQVDKGGKINANFIPGDTAVENYLRNNIESLRQRFTDENIAYGDLTYSQSRRQKNNKERNNKENGHE
jgi:hypothetical protein